MTGNKIREKVRIREIIEIPNLEIYENLFDVPIRFSRGNFEIQIRFPGGRGGGPGQLEIESSGRTTTPDGVTTEHFFVSGVELIVDYSSKLELSAAAMNVFPRREEHFTKKEVKKLDTCLEELRVVGNRALTEWLEICRWTTGNSVIGDSPRDFYAYMPDPALRIVSSDHRFWCLAGAESRVIYVRPAVTLANWREIERRLAAGTMTPIWYTYIFEAQNKLRRRDFRGSVLVAAIACETLIRRCLQCEIGNNDSLAASELIDRINVRPILDRLRKFDSLEIPKKPVFSASDVHKLFDLRNDEMHQAALKVAGQNEIKDLIMNARKFIDFVHPQLELK